MHKETTEQILSTGSLEPRGQFVYGSNSTFLVTVTTLASSAHSSPIQINAVYKPQRGERPLWDFPDGTLAAREAAAYRLSECLGWGIVPPTVFREDAPFGPGSLQLFIEHDPKRHYFNLLEDDLPRLAPVALFDLLCNNADRKGSHILFRSGDDQLYAIDHGLCFHTDDKLRTVIWNFANTAIPAGLVLDLRNVFDNTRALASLESALDSLLTVEEINALTARALKLLADPRFPAPPDDKRAYPFPPL